MCLTGTTFHFLGNSPSRWMFLKTFWSVELIWWGIRLYKICWMPLGPCVFVVSNSNGWTWYWLWRCGYLSAWDSLLEYIRFWRVLRRRTISWRNDEKDGLGYGLYLQFCRRTPLQMENLSSLSDFWDFWRSLWLFVILAKYFDFLYDLLLSN